MPSVLRQTEPKFAAETHFQRTFVDRHNFEASVMPIMRAQENLNFADPIFQILYAKVIIC